RARLRTSREREWGRFDFENIGGTTGNSLTMRVGEDRGSGEVVVSVEGHGTEKGCYGVQWGIGGVSDEYDLIVPGRSGIRITRDDPLGEYRFGYPGGWEAQFVIVQGDEGGFCVWAEDRDGVFKELVLRRQQHRWLIGFATQNAAPFDERTSAKSVQWRLFSYDGDWRVPARRYRTWAEKNFGLTRLQDQRPSWVKDVRFLAITGMDRQTLEALANEIEPAQTLLYVPGWRRDGYDRNYPDYTALPDFGPFVQHAHELGFRVMAHVNYFGCDPLNALYDRFAKYQFRDPFTGALQWWRWDRAEPPIEFAYINPAAKEWRELFVARMKTLCTQYPVDALHLDQSIGMTNTAGGLIDGTNAIRGNILLHRALREALPDVALSGEGLDEVTLRHEAFAQRHVWGIDHVERSWERRFLQMAHPVSSYVFTPYTTIYGYLGMANPTHGQFYAAWREAYRNWGVIPTYARPSVAQISEQKGFVRQVLAEARFFQRYLLEPDIESEWPRDVAFPYRGADGVRAAYVCDRGTVLTARHPDGRREEVTRVVSGVESVSLPGSIDGWATYDETRIFGLDPKAWYAYSTTPRDQTAFHVAALPEGMTARYARIGGGIATLTVEDARRVAADMVALLPGAETGFQRFGGEPTEFDGMFQDRDSGAQFMARGGALMMHPPWRPAVGGIGETTGVSYARYTLTLPKARRIQFLSEVAIADGAVGPDRTDGVLYSVKATAGELEAENEVLAASTSRQPLNLDLTQFAGREVSILLQVHPGPAHDVKFDWARWYEPRIEVDRFSQGVVQVVCPEPVRLVLAAEGEATLRPDARPGRYSVSADVPNTFYLLSDTPPAVELPVRLHERDLRPAFVSHAGAVLASPQYAGALAGEWSCGGRKRPGIFAHPPDGGQTVLDFPMTLPDREAELAMYVGLRDGAKSSGCIFIVAANGKTLYRRSIQPGDGWQGAQVDLAAYAGRPVVLSLVTDSGEDFICDWACWGEPVVRAK
ncbi:MAG: DUF6259 domain-containing protein, partial [Armatimonadota bacterium]